MWNSNSTPTQLFVWPALSKHTSITPTLNTDTPHRDVCCVQCATQYFLRLHAICSPHSKIKFADDTTMITHMSNEDGKKWTIRLMVSSVETMILNTSTWAPGLGNHISYSTLHLPAGQVCTTEALLPQKTEMGQTSTSGIHLCHQDKEGCRQYR